MDRHVSERKKEVQSTLLSWMLVGALVSGSYLAWQQQRVRLAVYRVAGVYSSAWQSFQDKVITLRAAEAENYRLRLENAHLRLAISSHDFQCRSQNAVSETDRYEVKLKKETGSRVGRTLASIPYRVPTHVTPEQLYVLGISYFKNKDFEKSAVIFEFLTNMEEDKTYQAPKDLLMAGISWYRLDNLVQADRYFDRVLSAKDQSENVASLAQARLWKGLVAERMGRHHKAQVWLKQLLDLHPHSIEASWVNAREVDRAPAEH